MSKNRYTKALKHLKNKALDEKLELLSEIPTNNTTGIYVDVPGRPAPEEIIPGPIDSPLDLDQDGDGEEGYEGKDTTGLFLTDGTIRAVEPPGDTSYILGPMISMWYAWANYTQIGYVRQEDRKMVNLGRITGQLENWDEESGFTSYGQMTLDQAVWYNGQTRQDYRAFYPGPPSNPADEYGRYLGSIIATSKATTTVVPENPNLRFIDGTGKPADPTDNFALAMDRGGAAVGIGLVIWMGIEGVKVFQNLIDSLTPEERERLFDNNTSQFGDTNAAAAAAEKNIGYEMASARGPYGTPGADKPYVRRGYKDKEGKFVDFDNPATWPSIVPKLPRASGKTDTMVAHYIAHGHFIKEQASGGGTITAHTEAGDVTINLPSTPPMPPEENTGMRTTPQGVDPLTDYSKNTLNWLKSQSSEYFVSGYIQGTEPATLEKMFAGTTIKWYQVDSMVSEIKETEKARDEAYVRSSEIWDEVSPQIGSLLDQMGNLLSGDFDYGVYYGQYMPLANEVDRLFAVYDDQMDVAMKLSEKSLTLSGQLGRYVQSGTIVDMDPFKLNDPTIKKEKELDEKEINDLINELKKAASDAKRSAALNKLKAFGYGALLAAGAVIGFKLLTGSAAVKALSAPVVNTLKKLAPKVKTTPKPLPKDASGLPQQLKAAAERAFDKLASKAPNDPTARGLLDRLSRAESSGSSSAVEKALKAFERYMGGTPNSPGGLFNSHEPSGKLLTENRKRILRNIKKPIKVKEAPTKFKVKPTGRTNKVVGSSMMKNVETPVTYKPITNIWSKEDKMKNIRASQEKKNQVLELVGAAEHHWTYLTEDRRRKKQDKINEMLSAEYDKDLEKMYEEYKKSPEGKAEKMINRIRGNIQPEYPKTAPPQMDPETGMHPKYGKKYKHDKLDPHSAESMPPTGDPVIDANAKKAHDPVQKARKLKNLIGKMRQHKIDEAMTTAGLVSSHLPAMGDTALDTVSDVTIDDADILEPYQDYPPPDYAITALDQSLGTIDASKYDTLKLTISGSFNTRTVDGSVLNDKVWIGVLINGTYAGNYLAQELGAGTHVIPIPARFQKANMRFGALKVYAFQGVSTPTSITNIQFQRRTPKTVFVALDDPESLPFNRGGLGGDKERRKKLKDMLDAGNELMVRNGVEPSKTSPGDIALDTIPYEPPSPGPGGYKPPGSYDPNKFFDVPTNHGPQFPSPNLPDTGPGRSSVPDGTKVAASYPKMDPLDKLLKDIDDADKKLRNQGPGTRPGKGRGMGDRWEGPGKIV